MTINEFTKQSEKLGYSIKRASHKLGFFDYDCTTVVDKHNREVAFILEDRCGSYGLTSPAPKSAECNLIDTYAFTSLTDRKQPVMAQL